MPRTEWRRVGRGLNETDASAQALARRPHGLREQGRGGAAGQPDALAREVRLVGVARGVGEPREVGLRVARREAQEALEAQDAGEGLRAVADRVGEAPAQ